MVRPEAEEVGSAISSQAAASSGPLFAYLICLRVSLERNPMINRVVAVEYVRRMRGGSQAHLLRCSDGEYYVVKFQNNPKGTRILANKLWQAFWASVSACRFPKR